MSYQEEMNQLERRIAKFEAHVAEQDGEMFRQSKRIDALTKRCEKLEGRMGTGNAESPIDANTTPEDEKPPHY